MENSEQETLRVEEAIPDKKTSLILVIVITAAVSALVASGLTYLFTQTERQTEPVQLSSEAMVPEEDEALDERVVEDDLTVQADEPYSDTSVGAVRYNCELSDGQFIAGKCNCPIEEGLGQTSELMYNKYTGFCDTTAGGPGGDAYWASKGLPYGKYSHYISVVKNNCKQSNGEFLNGCKCGEKTYNKSTGFCE